MTHAIPHQQEKFCTLYSLYFAAYMSFFSFYGVWLTQNGFSKTELGLISTGTAIVNFAALTLSGVLMDRYALHKKGIILTSILSGFFCLFLLASDNSFATVLFAILPVSFLCFALLGMLDSWTSIAAQSDSRVQYSIARGFGNLSGALTTLLLGPLLARIGVDKIVWFHLGLQLCLTLVVISLPNQVVNTSRHRADSRGDKSRNPVRFQVMLAAVILIFLGWRVILTYLPAMIIELGGDSSHQGFSMAAMSICTMGTMCIYPRLRKRYTCESLILFGAACMVLRILSMAFVSSLNMLILVQALEAVSYGIFQPAMMQYIATNSHLRRCASMLSLYTGAQMAVSSVVANLLAAWIIQFQTLRVTFYIFSGLAFIGVVILYFILNKGVNADGQIAQKKNQAI